MYFQYKITPIREKFQLYSSPRTFPVHVEMTFDTFTASDEVIYNLPYPKVEFGPILKKHFARNPYVPTEDYCSFLNEIEESVYEEIEMSDLTLDPLTQWYCDSCSSIIKNEHEGILQCYIQERWGRKIADGFMIVHKNDSCTYPQHDQPNSIMMGLEPNGRFGRLLSIQDSYIIQNKETFSEITKRLEIPYYEQARLYLDEDEHHNINYDRHELRKIVIKNMTYSNSTLPKEVTFKIHSVLYNSDLSLRAKGLLIYNLFFDERPFKPKILSEAFSDTISQVRSGLKEIKEASEDIYNHEEYKSLYNSSMDNIDERIIYKHSQYLHKYNDLYDVLNDRNLSWAAKGFYLYFIDTGFEELPHYLVRHFCKDRALNIENAIRELYVEEYLKDYF